MTETKEEIPLVGVVMGSDSDLPIMKETIEQLDAFGIPCEAKVLSAHRTPDPAIRYAKEARNRGLKVLIAGAGGAAHLAGILSANTHLPVIGVPIDASSLNGMDALLSTVQMPPGIPVSTMAIGKAGAKNAAIQAARILAIGDGPISLRLRAELFNYSANMEIDVLEGKQQKVDKYMNTRHNQKERAS